MHTKTIKYQSITSNETKNRQSFAPSPPPPHSLLLFPLSFLFFQIIMSCSAEFWCYIGSWTLATWPTVLAGLLPSWPMALGSNVVAHGARLLTPWRMTLCFAHAKGPLPAAPTAVDHGVMYLMPWATTTDVYFCKICIYFCKIAIKYI
jgi:hypothetical protein